MPTADPEDLQNILESVLRPSLQERPDEDRFKL